MRKSLFVYSVCGWLSFTLWGLNSIYWNVLGDVPLDEIVAHRFLWSTVFLWGYLLLRGFGGLVSQIVQGGACVFLIHLTSALLLLNWVTFNYAVLSHHILHASLGYYIAPLMFVCLSVLVLKEPLNALKWVAVALAAVGVIYLTVLYAALPWISLLLALSFSLYGLLKRFIPLQALLILGLECLCVAPFALYFLLGKVFALESAFVFQGAEVSALLVFAGIVTLVPLILFNVAVQRIPLSSIGFMQYMSPTLSLFVALILGERFSYAELPGFLCIWGAVILYFVSEATLYKAYKG